jgi:hypothetical protein
MILLTHIYGERHRQRPRYPRHVTRLHSHLRQDPSLSVSNFFVRYNSDQLVVHCASDRVFLCYPQHTIRHHNTCQCLRNCSLSYLHTTWLHALRTPTAFLPLPSGSGRRFGYRTFIPFGNSISPLRNVKHLCASTLYPIQTSMYKLAEQRPTTLQ